MNFGPRGHRGCSPSVIAQWTTRLAGEPGESTCAARAIPGRSAACSQADNRPSCGPCPPNLPARQPPDSSSGSLVWRGVRGCRGTGRPGYGIGQLDLVLRRDRTIGTLGWKHWPGPRLCHGWRPTCRPPLGGVCSIGCWRWSSKECGTDTTSEPLANQILAGELPLTLMHQFPELQSCRALRPAGRDLCPAAARLLDGEGLPQSAYLGILRPLLACSDPVAGDRRQAGLGWRERSPIRPFLGRGHSAVGALMCCQGFSSDEAGVWTPKLFKLALQLTGDKQLVELSEIMLPTRKSVRRCGAASRSQRP